MLNRYSRILALLAASLSLMAPSMGTVASQESADPIPRSIILLIGDGFDDQHVTMGMNFLAGHGGTTHRRHAANAWRPAGRNYRP